MNAETVKQENQEDLEKRNRKKRWKKTTDSVVKKNQMINKK